MRQIINDGRGAPLSAIVVFSDGGQNAGVDLRPPSKRPRKRRFPLHASASVRPTTPTNVRVSDLVAPAGPIPAIAFQVTGYLQSQGLDRPHRDGGTERARRRAKGKGHNGEPVLEKTEQVTLGGDSKRCRCGSTFPASTTAGRRIVRLRIKPIAEDQRPNRQPARSRCRYRRSQKPGPAVCRRTVARISIPAQHAPPQRAGQKRRHDRRRAAAIGRRRSFARRQRNPRPIPAHDAGAVAVRHDRGLRSRLARARSAAN